MHILYKPRFLGMVLTFMLFQYPFEVGETVWVVKPDYRAPLGEFRIVKAHPDDFFELVRGSDNQPHTELIAGKDLRRGV